jgi:dCTP deaminase
MRLLTNEAIRASLEQSDANSLFIEPLLRAEQVGALSVDLRIGYDFLVSVLTRRAAIEVFRAEQKQRRGIHSFFQETRRRFGERFVLYPHQAVLGTTIEYVALPTNMYAEISIRSSYSRLGLDVQTVMQPGWRGAIPLEIFNHSNTPVELVVGACFCQARIFELDANQNYVGAGTRKYYGNVRPTISKVDEDRDLPIISKMGYPPT